MVLASHIIIAGLLGSQTENYFLAAAIGFSSHYVLDGIPHWDYLSEEFEAKAQGNPGFMKNKNFWREIGKGALDILIGLVLLFSLTNLNKSSNTTAVFTAAIFGILPDPLGLLYWMTKWKIIKWNSDIQNFVHHSIHKKIDHAFWPGISIQVAAIWLVFIIIFYF